MHLLQMIVQLDIIDERCDGGRERCDLERNEGPCVRCAFPFNACYWAFFVGLVDGLEHLTPNPYSYVIERMFKWVRL